MGTEHMSKSSPEAAPEKATDGQSSSHRYLLFNIGGQLFGTLLRHVREIVTPVPTKPIPSTVPHFLGVINLRGKIIGILDLRVLFAAEPLITEKLAFVIFDTDDGPLGAVVDSVESVTTIEEAATERNPTIATRIPLNYLVGIGHVGNKLVSIINLRRILSDEELTKMQIQGPDQPPIGNKSA